MKTATVLSIMIALLFSAQPGLQRKPLDKVDSDALAEECQESVEPTPGMNIIWYVPPEFWAATLHGEEGMSRKTVEDFTAAIEGHFLLGVLRADISDFGRFTFHNENKVREKLAVVYRDSDGKRHKLTAIEKPKAELQMILGMIKPVITAAMGNMGEGFHFYVYQDTGPQGERLVDPYAPGQLVIDMARLSEETGGRVTIDMPLNTLYVPRTCCNKSMHVSWNYCPHCGQPLGGDKPTSTRPTKAD